MRSVSVWAAPGHQNAIHKHLVQWREARPVAAVAAPELPQALTAAIAGESRRPQRRRGPRRGRTPASAGRGRRTWGRRRGAGGRARRAGRAGGRPDHVSATRWQAKPPSRPPTWPRRSSASSASSRRQRPPAWRWQRHGSRSKRRPSAIDRAGRRDRAPTRRTGRSAAGPHRRRATGRPCWPPSWRRAPTV